MKYNLSFAASKCRGQRQVKFSKMAESSNGYSFEALLAACARKRKLQRKITDDYWLGAEESIGMFS